MKLNRIAQGVVLLGLAALAACGGAGGETAGSPRSAVPVQTAPVVVEKRSVPIRTSGRLASKAEVTLSFKVAGVIAQILVDEGARVRRGQALARLDLAEIDAQVAQARSVLERARRDLERIERLFEDSVVTRSQLEESRTAAEVAQAQLEIAEFNRRYSVITAPDDGRVLGRFTEEGELVTAGLPILRLGVATGGWVIRVGIADRDIVRLALGDSAAVHFDAYPNLNFAGRVTQIAGAADAQTGTFPIEVELEDPQGLLKSGFIGRVNLYPSDTQDYAIVPIEALVEGEGEEAVVFALTPGSSSAERRVLKLAGVTEEGLLVISGLEGADRVVTEGSAYLQSGSEVWESGDEGSVESPSEEPDELGEEIAPENATLDSTEASR